MLVPPEPTVTRLTRPGHALEVRSASTVTVTDVHPMGRYYGRPDDDYRLTCACTNQLEAPRLLCAYPHASAMARFTVTRGGNVVILTSDDGPASWYAEIVSAAPGTLNAPSSPSDRLALPGGDRDRRRRLTVRQYRVGCGRPVGIG
jgi:hypothetical protein